jgi:mRNA interferase RelE/StbE
MTYRLRYTDTAWRDLRDVPGNYRHRFRRLIESLTVEPRTKGAKELRERPDRYRIRVDRWRLIYRVDDEEALVIILRVRLKTGPDTYQESN